MMEILLIELIKIQVFGKIVDIMGFNHQNI